MNKIFIFANISNVLREFFEKNLLFTSDLKCSNICKKVGIW